jgi:glucoamylase
MRPARRHSRSPPVKRYLVEKKRSAHALWRVDQARRTLPAGTILRLEVAAPAVIRWSSDGWKTTQEVKTRDSGLGMHVADLPTQRLPDGADVEFRVAGQDFHITVEGDDQGESSGVSRRAPGGTRQLTPLGSPGAK